MPWIVTQICSFLLVFITVTIIDASYDKGFKAGKDSNGKPN